MCSDLIALTTYDILDIREERFNETDRATSETMR